MREQGKRALPLLDADTFDRIEAGMRAEVATKTKRFVHRHGLFGNVPCNPVSHVSAYWRPDMLTLLRQWQCRKINCTFHNCFTGAEAVAWLVANGFARSEREAVTLGNLMLNRDVIAHTSGSYPFTSENVYYYFKRYWNITSLFPPPSPFLPPPPFTTRASSPPFHNIL
jgi:hypothetical protein